jgi:hypothetical protein
MAIGKKSTDRWANIAAVRVVESAANTLTTLKYQFPFSIMDKVGLIISRIEYWPESLDQLNSASDIANYALIAASTVTDITNQADALIIDSLRIARMDLGAAASGFLNVHPIVKDFSNLVGGGILVAPAPLYAAIKGTGAGAAMQCWIKLFYTYQSMSTDEYWELVESRRIIGS